MSEIIVFVRDPGGLVPLHFDMPKYENDKIPSRGSRGFGRRHPGWVMAVRWSIWIQKESLLHRLEKMFFVKGVDGMLIKVAITYYWASTISEVAIECYDYQVIIYKRGGIWGNPEPTDQRAPQGRDCSSENSGAYRGRKKSLDCQ